MKVKFCLYSTNLHRLTSIVCAAVGERFIVNIAMARSLLGKRKPNAIQQMLEAQRKVIMEQDASVTGFNVGINAGASAGQKQFRYVN